MGESSSPLSVFYHPDYERPTQPPGHPECPERVRAIMDLVKRVGIPIEVKGPARITTDDLRLVHVDPHIDRVREFGVGFMDPDTFHFDHTYDTALKAAGGVFGAVSEAYDGKRATFALPRPPGHHAGADYNMGFCYFNNAAMAARKAQREIEGLGKVAIVDIDAHHGNGTCDIFYSDPTVLYISTHQWGIFPGTGHFRETGAGKGEGRTVNLPLNGGSGDMTFQRSYEDIIQPVLAQFSPDLLIVSLGGDSHQMDPLTGLSLSTPGYLYLTKALHEFANKNVQGRICYELEGGYHLKALAEVFAGTMNQTLPEPREMRILYDESREASPDDVRIKEMSEHHSSYWKL